MTATLLTSNTFGFADGNSGHSCNLGSSPSVNQVDVLCVNSNTTVSTPSGFTAAPTSVSNQGSYIFRRKAVGGEGSTVTITTTGNFDTAVVHSRWGNINAADDATGTSSAASGTSSPSHTTNALAETNELAIAFAATHSFPGSNPTSPVWGGSYTALASASSGTNGNAVVGFVGYKLTAGTAAESPSVSWTNTANDRDILVLTFTTTSGPIIGNLGIVSETDTAQPISRLKLRTETIISETDTVQPMTRLKKLTLGLITETDTVQAMTRRHSRTLNQVTESDSLLALARRKSHTLGQVSETSIALGLVLQTVVGHVPVLATITTGTPLTTVKTNEVIRIVSA